MAEFELLSVVALLEDIPDRELLRGHVGTVVETLAPGVFEVEFSNDNGQPYATRDAKRKVSYIGEEVAIDSRLT